MQAHEEALWSFFDQGPRVVQGCYRRRAELDKLLPDHVPDDLVQISETSLFQVGSGGKKCKQKRV